MPEATTDQPRGALSREDRERFLAEWWLPESTTDDEILLAIGTGLF
jgi:hypothetical protein